MLATPTIHTRQNKDSEEHRHLEGNHPDNEMCRLGVVEMIGRESRQAEKISMAYSVGDVNDPALRKTDKGGTNGPLLTSY